MSSEPRGSSKAKNKARLSFKELLDNKGDSQEQKGRPNKAKDTKASFGHQEQLDSQGNCVVVPYSFDVPIALWFWPYPCYRTPLNYSRMHMQLYYIQYASVCPSCTS